MGPYCAAESRVSGLRILVVDDEAELLAVLGEYLRGAGHEVVTASSGREAVAALDAADEPFTVAVVDWSMAGISGRDVIGHVRERSPDTILFVATAHAAHEVSELHCEFPLAGIFRKPFSLRALARAIGQAVSKVEDSRH